MEIQQDPHAFGCEAVKPPAGAESESVQLNESSLLKGYILIDGEGLFQGLIIFLFPPSSDCTAPVWSFVNLNVLYID